MHISSVQLFSPVKGLRTSKMTMEGQQEKMAKELLSGAKEELRTVIKRDHVDLEKPFFDFPRLVAIIEEAEAKFLTPTARAGGDCATTLNRFLELKAFVYEVEDRLDELRIEALMSQERGFVRVGSKSLHRQGPHRQSEPDEQGNTHLIAQACNKVRKFLFICHRNFRHNFTDLESKLDKNFSWINEIHSPRNFTATENSEYPWFPPNQWKSIMDCEIWEADRSVSHNLCLTLYSSLPKHLKLCFKYFSLIPKGYWIEKEVLIQLWMAEGFTDPEDEETAVNHFDELLFGTTFFKDIEKDEDGNIVRCKIHEPLHDIICHVSEREFSVVRDGGFSELCCLHSSLCCINKVPDKDFKYDSKKLRTLLCFRSPSNLKVSDLISNFKLLRVLDLSSSIIEELPHSVAKLEYLRYLNLSNTQIKKLPASICNLYLLQTLKLSHSLLSELPRETWKLQKLRHLEIDGTPMNHLAPGIGKLVNIRNLSEFIVGGDGGCSIEELKNLQHLRGSLIISHLDRVVDKDEGKRAKLDTKSCIKHLILDGKKHFNSRNLRHKRRFNSLLLECMCTNEAEFKPDDDCKMKSEGVFEGIKPHSHLKKLEIWNYFGSKLPAWLEDESLRELVSLKVAKCLNMEHMPHLGRLPSLKFLHICGMDEVKSIEICDLEGFPKLEQLTLEEMPKWEEWKFDLQEGALPCLLELILSNCPRLKKLPAMPQTLRKLEIHDCKDIEWHDPLPTLECLVLKGKVGNLFSLPDAPNLFSLTIALSPEMTSFPNGFEKLKSLSALIINFCPRLASLPNELEQHRNLHNLHIAGCRLLEKWLKKNEEVWKNIPNVLVENKVPTISNLHEKSLASPSGYGNEDTYNDDYSD